MVEELVSVKLSKRLREMLKKEGVKGESYDDILWRLLGQKTLTKEQHQRIKQAYEDAL